MASRVGFVLARLLVFVFVFLTAGYCLFAYLPFTYHQVVLGALLPWLSSFARLHSYLYWPALVAAASTLPWRNRNTRSRSILFIAVYGAIGIFLFFKPLLSGLENNLHSLLWSILSLTPLLALAAIDWPAASDSFRWAQQNPGETRRIFRASLFTAIYAWLCSLLLVVARIGLGGAAGFGTRQWIITASGSLLFHLMVLMAVFLALNFTQAVAAVFSSNLKWHVLLYGVTGAGLGTLAFKSIVFAPLSFYGWWALITAFAASISMVSFLAGTAARLYQTTEREIESPPALLLSPLSFLKSLPQSAQVAFLIAGSVIAGRLLTGIGVMDWEYMIQKLLVIALWTGAFGFFYVTAPAPAKRNGDLLVVAAAAMLFVYLGFMALPAGRQAMEKLDKQASLREYADRDVSFRLTRAVLSPPVAVSTGGGSFYSFLLNNTNIPRSLRIDPVSIDLAGNLAPTPGPKPNIFIIVIDSLRRDYLSTYNSAVTFTPNIDAFSRESAVARNAFTHYTGTGLSEPSIWTGAMLLHQQYITPFAPMNSLQKLLEFEQYRQFITKDEILTAILEPSQLVTELDAGRPTMSCELCSSLTELEGRITESASTGSPTFAYTQPQNIHVSVINREGRSVPPGEGYPGFDAAYASRVKAMDQCFGNFIQFLKNQGLYENSVVVLAADHGDSLGEGGRWGHAYHITPEVVRVPLIVHLPTAMNSLQFDSSAPAFLTDIAPSLYYLLGHKPTIKGDLYGKPLFTATPEEARNYLADSYLVASSYGPVYGLLRNSGRSLYVANAIEYEDNDYEWSDDTNVGRETITAEIRTGRQEQIRNFVNEIGRFYNFSGPR